MKILFLTDTHITAKTPSSRLDDIQESIKMKFKEIGVLIQKEGIEIVLHGGDMFHRPEVSNKFVGEIAEIIRGYNVPFYVTEGNHDLQGQNSESLPHTKLGLLHSTGVIKLLNRKNPLLLDDNGYKISIEGQEYHPNIDKDPDKDYKIYNQTANFKILVAHSMLLERPYHEGTTYTLIDNVDNGADLVLSGHYHPGHGYKENKKGIKFINPGSLVRVEASTHSINTMPKVAILDISDKGFSHTLYELKTAKKGSEVFSSTNLEKKNYSNSLENFNAKLKNIKLDDVNIIKLIDDYVTSHPEDLEIVKKAKDEIVKIQREEVVDNGYIPATSNVSIDKVVLKNFQTHEDLSVDFVNGLNTITGESNAGKTAIIRAVIWALYDKPNGSAFITTGKKSCKVEVHLSNGYIVERSRSRSSSGAYHLTRPDGTKTEYKGFSNNIPIDIVNAHQMPEISIGGKKYRLNISSQLEGPFLVTSSSEERMTMIGALVDADRADRARKAVNSEKRNLSTSYKKVEEIRNTEAEKLKKFANLDKMKVTVDMLEMADEKLDRDEEVLRILEDTNNYYSQTIYSKTFIDDRLSSMAIPDRNDIDELSKLIDSVEKLQDLNTLYTDNVYSLYKIEKDLSCIGQIVDSSDINEYKELISELEQLQSLYAQYNNCMSSLSEISNKINSIQNTISSDDIELFKSLLSEMSEMVDLTNQYSKLSKESFSFSYDLDLLKEVRGEYVSLMREVIELKNLESEIKVHNSSIESILNEQKCTNMNLDELNVTKRNKLKLLSSEITICETCGSEVTADKLIV